MATTPNKRLSKIISHLHCYKCSSNKDKNSEQEQDTDSLVHYQILQYILNNGHAPDMNQLSVECDLSMQQTLSAIKRLEDNHGVVLHPNSNPAKIWIIHPFSLTPTLFWVESLNPKHKDNNNRNKGWWAPCIWCASGVAHLIGGNANIHTKLGGETQNIVIKVRDDKIIGNDLGIKQLYGHFGISVMEAWDNVHHFCGVHLLQKIRCRTHWASSFGHASLLTRLASGQD